MGKVLPVDVPGSDLGLLDVVVIEGQGRAIIVLGLDALQGSAGVLVQNKNLSLGIPFFALHNLLAVHF